MSAVRTPWHLYFAIFLSENAAPDVQVKFEIILTTEPQRGDLLLLRRDAAGHRDAEARTFRGLWPLLRSETVAEFKSLAWPLRKGDLARLQGYGAQYTAARIEEGAFELEELSLVLIVPTRTPTLDEELARMGWTMEPLSRGYARIVGSGYAMYLVIIEDVAQAEQDELLGLFSRKKWTEKQSSWFWMHHAGKLEGISVQETEDYKRIVAEALASMPLDLRLDGLTPEEILSQLAPEQRLAGMAPEQRLAGLTEAQRVLAMPDAALRALSEDYLRTLPEEVVAAIHERLGRPSVH